jgi:futalosine hydrolase
LIEEARGRLVPPIGLISAVPLEGKIILRNLKKIHEKVPYGSALYQGKIYDKSVVYITSGIGKTNASRGTTILIERFSPRIIVNFGVGGAYPSSGLQIGDIAVAEKEIYGDEGVSLNDGFHTAEVIGIPFFIKARKRYFNEFQFDKRLFKMAVRISHITRHTSRITVKSGHFLTISTCTGTLKRAKELENKFHVICENMEGAAVAHVCVSYGIPVVEIRGISNTVEDRDMKRWDIRMAAENCQKVVKEFLKEI